MNVASMGSFIVAALAFLLSFISSTRNNTRQYATQIAELATEMREMSLDIKEIKANFKDEMGLLKASISEDHDKLIQLGMSLEAAWKQIDELRNRH